MSGLTDISVSNYMDIKVNDVAVADLESFSGLTDELNVIEVKQYNRKFPRKLVGSSTGSTLELVCSLNPASESYTNLMSAKTSSASVPVQVVYFGDAAKTAANSATRTFTAVVTGYAESAEFDAQRTVTWTLAIDSDIVYANGGSARTAK
ncbi:hypothetical protein AB6Q85_002323 [Vibrio cholerae]